MPRLACLSFISSVKDSRNHRSEEESLTSSQRQKIYILVAITAKYIHFPLAVIQLDKITTIKPEGLYRLLIRFGYLFFFAQEPAGNFSIHIWLMDRVQKSHFIV